jgi:hypothetical protein
MDASTVVPDQRVQEEHYREVAARLRLMADIEPLSSVRRHLRWLAKEHDEVAASIRTPRDPALPYKGHDADLT